MFEFLCSFKLFYSSDFLVTNLCLSLSKSIFCITVESSCNISFIKNSNCYDIYDIFLWTTIILSVVFNLHPVSLMGFYSVPYLNFRLYWFRIFSKHCIASRQQASVNKPRAYIWWEYWRYGIVWYSDKVELISYTMWPCTMFVISFIIFSFTFNFRPCYIDLAFMNN